MSEKKKRKPTLVEPETVRRLRAIKPGEVLTYYRGDFEQNCKNAPALFKKQLEWIFNTARELAKQGKIELFERPQEKDFRNGKKGPLSFYVYEAKGVQHAD